MKKSYVMALICSSVLVWACNNEAEDNSVADSATTEGTAGTVNGTGMVSETDKEFVMKAASGGMMEVQAGELAQQNGMNERVKNFGTMMVNDHGKANAELKSIAANKNIMLPDSMMPEHKEHLEMLKIKKGREFDQTYMTLMVDDHKKDVNEFEQASNNVNDAEIKAFASKTVPVLKMHLDSAQAIKNKM